MHAHQPTYRKLIQNGEDDGDSLLLLRNRYLFVTRPEHLSASQKKVLNSLCERHKTPGHIRQFMLQTFALFEPGQSKQEAMARRKKLTQNPAYRFNFHLAKALRSLRADQFIRAITFLDYSNCPRTTNHVERTDLTGDSRAKWNEREST